MPLRGPRSSDMERDLRNRQPEGRMPDPKFTKPWHGVPREAIDWHPAVDEDACIGCGTCVTGCSRLVYRFDFERRKAVVVDPLNCMVGCTTCANTCPVHAIDFPSLDAVFQLEARSDVRHSIEDDLLARADVLRWDEALPHADRLIELRVEEVRQPSPRVLLVHLVRVSESDCLCQFSPGQYLELWVPDTPFLARAYSIANAPRSDGSVDLEIVREPGGRLSEWAFSKMKPGDRVRVRGPIGTFTVRSPLTRPLAFVAGGSGFAPISAMVEGQLRLAADRDMLLLWGARRSEDLYRLDRLAEWLAADPNLRVVIALEETSPGFEPPHGVVIHSGTALDAIHASAKALAGRDLYVAGPPAMARAVVPVLGQLGIPHDAIHVDAYRV
jgi:CDP-4-dehydro-6-deoxyglucose reductase